MKIILAFMYAISLVCGVFFAIIATVFITTGDVGVGILVGFLSIALCMPYVCHKIESRAGRAPRALSGRRGNRAHRKNKEIGTYRPFHGGEIVEGQYAEESGRMPYSSALQDKSIAQFCHIKIKFGEGKTRYYVEAHNISGHVAGIWWLPTVDDSTAFLCRTMAQEAVRLIKATYVRDGYCYARPTVVAVPAKKF